MTAHRDRVTALAHTTLDLGQQVDTVLRVQAEHGAAIGRIEEMLVKSLDGQAVLHQNDMELKRRLDERR